MKDTRKFNIFLLMLIPMFQPKIFTQYTVSTVIYIFLNVIELVYFIWRYSKNGKKFSQPMIGWIIYRMYMLIIMVMRRNFSGILQWGYLSLMVINLIFVFDIAKEGKEGDLVRSISLLGNILLAINFATLLIYKRGIIRSNFYNVADGDYYFLGIKTQFTTMIFPTITAAIYYYNLEKNKKSRRILVFAIILSLLNIFYKNISTAIVGGILIILFILIEKILKLKLNFKSCIIIAICIHILVVFFNIQEHFSFFIEGILNKDATLSSRVYIWHNTKELLKNESLLSLIFGNGLYNNNNFVPYAGRMWQPHNQLLLWIYSSGIVGTILILHFFRMIIPKKYTNDFKYRFIIIMCFTILILSVTELYFDVAVCYVPYIMMYYCTNISESEKEGMNK